MSDSTNFSTSITDFYNIRSISCKKKKTFEEFKQISVDALLTENVIVFRFFDWCDNCFQVGTEYTIFDRFLKYLLDQKQIKISTLKDVINGDQRPIPDEYTDPPPKKLLPETRSKLIVAMSTVAGMIVLIGVFFGSLYVRDVCQK